VRSLVGRIAPCASSQGLSCTAALRTAWMTSVVTTWRGRESVEASRRRKGVQAESEDNAPPFAPTLRRR